MTGENLTRWRLDLSYRGTDFSGWATQPGRRTVQGVLEEWLPKLLRVDHPVRLTCAGRTDAGVHARGQVCHLDLEPGVIIDDGDQLRHRFARVLPDDLVVRSVRPAAAGFDARFAAIWRRYCYRLSDLPVPPDPLYRGHVEVWKRPLDLDAMNDAAGHLVGLQDFAAFCKRRDGGTTIRTLIDFSGTRVDHGPLADSVEFTVIADAFCHSMVRSLVGALVRVGEGGRDVDWPRTLITKGQRDGGVPVMPAAGLTLEEVGYPPEHELAARVEESRRLRDPSEVT